MKNNNLNIYNKLYIVLKKVVIREGDNFNSKIAGIEMLANFSWFHHPGTYVDIDVEKQIEDLSKEVARSCNNERVGVFSKSENIPRQIVHVVSELYEVGGHTRLLANIINNDAESDHIIVLVRQNVNDVPECINELNVQIISVYENKDAFAKAIHLRNIVEQKAHIVFLHIHPDDALSLAALIHDLSVSIVFINHADHVFCLGTSLIDNIACIREWSVNFTLERRCAKRAVLLPILIKTDIDYNLSKKEARDSLGVNEGDILAISVASAYKFVPNGNYNFFALMKEVVDTHDNVKIKIIGVSNDDYDFVHYVNDENIELVGVVSDPLVYYVAADIYLDPMPLSSFTSLWEGCLYENAPMLSYSPLSVVAVDNEPVLKGVVSHAVNSDEWLRKMNKLVIDKEFRIDISNRVSANVKYYHSGQGWNSYYKNILNSERDYSRVSKCKHVEFEYGEDDVTSADLSAKTFGADKRFFLMYLEKNIKNISIYEIIYLFLCYVKITKRFFDVSFYRYILGILKLKGRDSRN